MKKLLFVLLSTLLFAACSNDNELKEKELQLKERELQVRENELIQKSKESEKPVVSLFKKKKLRYLLADAAGMLGYFDNGTVSYCEGCQLTQDGVKRLYKSSVLAKYTINSDGSLLTEGRTNFPSASNANWAMIDYVWQYQLVD